MQLNITVSLVEDDEQVILVKRSQLVRGGFFTGEEYAKTVHQVRGALLDTLTDVHKELHAEALRADECVAAHLAHVAHDGDDQVAA